MYWRIGPAYRRQAPEANQAAFHAIVNDGRPPGLLALSGGTAVGWCQLTPRGDLAWLDRAGKLRRAGDVPVWSISCFYIRKGQRRRGVTAALIDAAIGAAREAGGDILEAYPLDAAATHSTSFTGYSSTFRRAGFRTSGRRTAAQRVMRLALKPAPGE